MAFTNVKETNHHIMFKKPQNLKDLLKILLKNYAKEMLSSLWNSCIYGEFYETFI